WLLLAVPQYIKETGDKRFLDQVVPFADEGEATVYEHLRAALEFSWSQRGPHGLCLGLAADWNDCLNLKGRGETIFSTFLFLRAVREFMALAQRYVGLQGHTKDDLQSARAMEGALLSAIDEHAWDGKWFLRGYVDSGKKLGAADSEGSRIFLNAQSWAVLSEAAERDRLLQAMESVHERLATEHGAVLNAPAYVDHNAEIGAITTFPGGLKENAGIFCHANTWPV